MYTKDTQKIDLKTVEFDGELCRLVFLIDGEEKIRYKTGMDLAYMIDFYERSHVVKDGKSGEVFSDYLLSSSS